MKKSFKLKNLACADCARKMGDKISQLDGVKKANVNFMLSKLTVEVEKEEDLPDIKVLEGIIKSYENYCEII